MVGSALLFLSPNTGQAESLSGWQHHLQAYSVIKTYNSFPKWKKNIPKSFEKMNATLEITKENIIFSSQNKWRKRTSLHITLANLLVNL